MKKPYSFVPLAIGLIAPLSSCRSQQPSPLAPLEEAAVAAPDSVDVGPATEPPLVYALAAVFERVDRVVALEGDAERELDDAQWSFAVRGGYLLVRSDALSDGTSIRVQGRRKVPWAWHIRAWDPSSVRVILGDREGLRGRDFEVDAERGILALTSAEWSDPSRDLYVTYSLPCDPAHPDALTGVAFGNHRDNPQVRRVLGLPPAESVPAQAEPLVAQNASPTSDPAIFRLLRPQPSNGLRVGIARTSAGVDEWLEPDAYTYDEKTGEVRLLERRVDPASETLIVLGSRPKSRVIRLGSPLVPGDEVKIVVGGRRLVLGSDFEVDREHGEIAVFDVVFLQPGSRYLILAGSTMLGNMTADAETLALLED